MEFLAYLGVAIIISLIFVTIINLLRDKNMELQIELASLKSEYDEKYEEKYQKLKEENVDLKKYKTLYELEVSNRKGKK